jgi:hypothetical protein
VSESHYLLILLVRRVLRLCNAVAIIMGQIFTFGHAQGRSHWWRMSQSRQPSEGAGRQCCLTWRRCCPVRWPGPRPAMTTSLAAGNPGMPVLDLLNRPCGGALQGGSFRSAWGWPPLNAACICRPVGASPAEAASAAW